MRQHTVIISTRCCYKMYRQLKKRAKQDKCSMSNIQRLALEQYLGV